MTAQDQKPAADATGAPPIQTVTSAIGGLRDWLCGWIGSPRYHACPPAQREAVIRQTASTIADLGQAAALCGTNPDLLRDRATAILREFYSATAPRHAGRPTPAEQALPGQPLTTAARTAAPPARVRPWTGPAARGRTRL